MISARISFLSFLLTTELWQLINTRVTGKTLEPLTPSGKQIWIFWTATTNWTWTTLPGKYIPNDIPLCSVHRSGCQNQPCIYYTGLYCRRWSKKFRSFYRHKSRQGRKGHWQCSHARCRGWRKCCCSESSCGWRHPHWQWRLCGKRRQRAYRACFQTCKGG